MPSSAISKFKEQQKSCRKFPFDGGLNRNAQLGNKDHLVPQFF